MHGARIESRSLRLLLFFGLAAALASAATAVDLLVVFPRAANPGDGARRVVEVPPGVGPRQLAAIVARAGLTRSESRFALWLRITGGISGVRSGRFVLSDASSPREIVAALSGEASRAKLVVPEGFTIARIDRAAAAAGFLAPGELTAAATDARLLAMLGVPAATAEGFLFPDTYFPESSRGAEGVIRPMIENFERRVIRGLLRGRRPPDRELLDLVIMASIVQAEAADASEMPVIAGVFRNRLGGHGFSSRLLQADPTVAYGCLAPLGPLPPSCAGPGTTLTRARLDDAGNPYNTYRHPGLPPGPICNPGLDALGAALEPADVPYLYFVAGRDGRHVFSTTLEEHERAVAAARSGSGG